MLLETVMWHAEPKFLHDDVRNSRAVQQPSREQRLRDGDPENRRAVFAGHFILRGALDVD